MPFHVNRYLKIYDETDQLPQDVKDDLFHFCSMVIELVGDNFFYGSPHVRIMYEGYKEEYLFQNKKFIENE